VAGAGTKTEKAKEIGVGKRGRIIIKPMNSYWPSFDNCYEPIVRGFCVKINGVGVLGKHRGQKALRDILYDLASELLC
jgi:hypothetical protein